MLSNKLVVVVTFCRDGAGALVIRRGNLVTDDDASTIESNNDSEDLLVTGANEVALVQSPTTTARPALLARGAGVVM